jgi:hypothetical protein
MLLLLLLPLPLLLLSNSNVFQQALRDKLTSCSKTRAIKISQFCGCLCCCLIYVHSLTHETVDQLK